MNGIIADGAIRSGKTLSLSLSFVMWAMSSFDNQLFAMCGKTIASFRRNVLFPLKQMVGSLGYTLIERRSENLLIVRFGDVENRFYLFGGQDESSQDLIQGITLAGVLFDEAVLMPQSFINQAVARCSVEGSKFWFNCNPDGPKHPFKVEWIDKCEKKGLLYLHFDLDDNMSLSEETKNRYKMLYAGMFYRRYILGEWTRAEGLIYPMFDEDKHIVDAQNGRYERYYMSCDYGTMNPFSCGLWGLSRGRWYRIREYYYDGRKEHEQMTDTDYYEQIDKLAGGLPIQSIVIDPSASSFITLIKREGKYRVKQADNSVLDGIRRTASALQAGAILFDKSCKAIIDEFHQYSWDDESDLDKPLKESDHAMDDLRYFVNTIMMTPGVTFHQKPKGW